MCGITGIWAKNYNKDRLIDDLNLAVEKLRHRGPNDCGTWFNDSGIALGHTRLSILDLSPLGHQPMISQDGRYVIVFNGEIYNFVEIRARLKAMGHTFSGSGDTEVILRAFAVWGSEAVKEFIGMFAIALWDEHKQVLELIRDRIGVKPLYYGWDGASLCFGSELKALRAFRHWVPQIDLQSLGEFLQYGYIPDDRSIYQNVFKLRPGHRLRLKAGRQPVVEQYWSILDAVESPRHGSDEELEVELEELLVSACKYRMVSDVPVGVYLSGGVDSSLVTALLAKHHERPIQTFTIGFADNKYDESAWARKVADHCGTKHTEHILEPKEALEIARSWGSLYDEPFADSSSIPTLLVSRLASQDVKVVLSADGGDELFSGYNSYGSVLRRLERWMRTPRLLQMTAKQVLGSLPPAPLGAALEKLPVPAATRGDILRRLYRARAMFENPTAGGMIDVAMSCWKPEQVRQLLGQYDTPASARITYPGDIATQLSLRDFHHYLPGDILAKVDRTTMNVSIEGREPLLDHRLAEFALRLPLHLRRGTLGPKHILKKILYRHVPRDLVDRAKKGFAIPKVSWLQDDLRTLVEEYLAPERIRNAGIMDTEQVSLVVDDFYAGNITLADPLWYLLSFEMWREEWL